LLVRPFAPEDVPVVAVLERLCNPQPWSEEAIRPFAEADPASVGLARRALVAEADGRLAGYVIASRAVDEAEILVLGVHPDFRRMGMGRELLAALVGALARDGVRTVFLEVRAGNSAAIALYEALGFARAGLRRGYYANNGED